MFKKLLPILGLLLLVSCQIDTEDTELCANGDQTACQRIADSLNDSYTATTTKTNK